MMMLSVQLETLTNAPARRAVGFQTPREKRSTA